MGISWAFSLSSWLCHPSAESKNTKSFTAVYIVLVDNEFFMVVDEDFDIVINNMDKQLYQRLCDCCKNEEDGSDG